MKTALLILALMACSLVHGQTSFPQDTSEQMKSVMKALQYQQKEFNYEQHLRAQAGKQIEMGAIGLGIGLGLGLAGGIVAFLPSNVPAGEKVSMTQKVGIGLGAAGFVSTIVGIGMLGSAGHKMKTGKAYDL